MSAMTAEALVRRLQYLILNQLDAADRSGHEPAVRATSLADQVLAGAHGPTPADFLRDALARLHAARDEWLARADDPDAHGAAALDALARELTALLDQL